MANTGLGRGLSSLIPNKKTAGAGAKKKAVKARAATNPSFTETPASEGQIVKIKIEEIKTNPMQPRKRFLDTSMEELVESIKEYGLIQPVVVTPREEGYELIAGERRLRAAREAGLVEVPAIVREADRQEQLALSLIENIQREDLNPIELAQAYKRLVEEFNMTHEEIAKKVGKSRPVITNAIRLLNLPEEMQLALIEGKIKEGHAHYLVGLDSEKKQTALFRKIIHNNLTIEDTNKEAKRMGGTKAARIKINYRDKDKEFLLREFFGTKVEIKRKGRGGQIIIDFYSDEELEEIVNKIK
jgi:ParB family chromosome partitioning protein